jgi:hypothetical protein
VLRQELSQEELEDLLLPPEGERGITVDIVREVYESDGLPEDLTSDVIAGTLELCKEDVKVRARANNVCACVSRPDAHDIATPRRRLGGFRWSAVRTYVWNAHGREAGASRFGALALLCPPGSAARWPLSASVRGAWTS